MLKLKKCPFCGGEAKFYGGSFCYPVYSDGEIYDVDWDDAPVYVKCKSCEASTRDFASDNEDQDYEDAADAWNRRCTNA